MKKDTFIGPTLFDEVKNNMKIYKEEIFGPVLSVIRAKDYTEAIDLINNHQFGNGSSIYTSDGNFGCLCFKYQNRNGWHKCSNTCPNGFHSFGGWKDSLFGDHSMHGSEGVKILQNLKRLLLDGQKTQIEGPEFKMPTINVYTCYWLRRFYWFSFLQSIFNQKRKI